MKNFMLVLSYDGSRYRGWQKQGNTPNTIQEKMENLLSRLLDQTVEINASGRTDAGVHAKHQVCSFRADTKMDCESLLRKIREHLPEDIAALSLQEAAPRFHARLNCREKTYVYRIWNSPEPNVFQRKYSYHCPDRLDIPAMEESARQLLGEHDFSAFCTKPNPRKSSVRDLKSIHFVKDGEMLEIFLTGNGFLYNMVRIIAGTLLEAGLGQRDAASVSTALSSLERKYAGFTAPAHGLFLWDVKY